jgi:hypothetical protein
LKSSIFRKSAQAERACIAAISNRQCLVQDMRTPNTTKSYKKRTAQVSDRLAEQDIFDADAGDLDTSTQSVKQSRSELSSFNKVISN